ncbi:MAG: hypothetical protein M1834_009568 [Cirrosporium novae-zelandiae]|nr:MAG: hypothetical protein M1834_009568 [Cirrosporium novae-zelandiae]
MLRQTSGRGVWGKDCTSAFERLVEAYTEIARALPRFDRLQYAFQGQETLQNALGLVYADILEFHRRAYKFFRRRAWQLFFDSLWKSFEPRFDEIIRSLLKHKELVDKEVSTIDIIESRIARREAQEELARCEKDRATNQLQVSLSWLDIQDCPQEDYLDKLSIRRHPETCKWTSRNSKLVSWMQDGPTVPFIWLNGLYAFDEYVSKGQNPSMVNTRRLLGELLQIVPSGHIGIDGLDEYHDKDHASILNALISLNNRLQEHCKILVSSRETGEIKKKLRSKSMLSLKDSRMEVDGDIRIYVKDLLIKLQESLNCEINEKIMNSIEQTLSKKATGMFLWVYLMVTTLENQYSVEDLQTAVNCLPEGLHGAYLLDETRSLDTRKQDTPGSGRATPKEETLNGIVAWLDDAAGVRLLVQDVQKFKRVSAKREKENRTVAGDKVLQKYETILEGLLDKPADYTPQGITKDEFQAFRQLFKTSIFMCRYQACHQSGICFATSHKRKKHEDNHTPIHYCSDSRCGISLKSARAMNQHMKTYNTKLEEEVSMFNPSCSANEGKEPSAGMSPSVGLNSLNTDFADLKPDSVGVNYKKEGEGWHAIFNPNIPRQLDFDLKYHFDYDNKAWCIAFSDDGKCFAVGLGHEAQLIDLSSGNMLFSFIHEYTDQNKSIVASLRFSPGGNTLVTRATDGHIRIWGIYSRELRSLLTGHRDSVSAIDISRNCDVIISLIAVGGFSGGILMRTIDGNINKIPAPDGSIYSVVFSPSGASLFSTSLQRTVIEWSVEKESGDISFARELKDLVEDACTLAVPYGSRWLLAGLVDGNVYCWDRNTGIPHCKLKIDTEFVLAVASNRSGDMFATCGREGKVGIWSYTDRGINQTDQADAQPE